MNIFVVDKDPVIAAQSLCDKHIVKMPVESAQMLSAAMILTGAVVDGLYKVTHRNHQCNVWARETKSNFNWLKMHGIALCEEYTRRYGRIHKSQSVIEKTFCDSIPQGELTPFALCMPDKYKTNNPVESYRQFYIAEKAYMAVWKYSEQPSWFCNE